MIPAIREFCRSIGEDDKPYLITDDIAQGNSAVVQWCRKGSKERIEERSILGAEGARTRAFDGQIVRELAGPAASPTGSISLPEDAHWADSVVAHPFAFLWEFVRGEPYFEIVAKGRGFSASEVIL